MRFRELGTVEKTGWIKKINWAPVAPNKQSICLGKITNCDTVCKSGVTGNIEFLCSGGYTDL